MTPREQALIAINEALLNGRRVYKSADSWPTGFDTERVVGRMSALDRPAKKKAPVALVALAPLVGFYSMLMPYIYWRAALWLWGPGESANGATFAAICVQVIAGGSFMVWRAQ